MPDLDEGQTIGNYRIIRKLGDGGFAEVYLAENIYISGIFVAIKIAKETFPLLDRSDFRKEAKIISQFRHPHIMSLHDFGLYNDNRPYLVMEYIEGGSLRDKYPRETKLDLSTIVSYIKQIADALQYIHNHTYDGQTSKTIHRDIKPANILMRNDNFVLLSDFGIAINIEATSYTTGIHEIIGTRAYMSPEHFTGQLRSASDQYSLAIMVYEWLCGNLPFTQGDIGYQHINIPPSPLHDKIATLPSVEEVVMKGLAKNPQQRYGSVIEFAQALEEASKFPCDACFPPDVAQAIRDCYFRSSNIANHLGTPVKMSEANTTLIKSRRGTEGYKCLFTKGRIYWCKRGDEKGIAQPIFLGFNEVHKKSGGVEGPLGFPLCEDQKARESRQGSTGTFQRFEGEEDYPDDVDTPPIRCGATTYWREKDRVYIVKDKIGECYERIHGTGSFLGFPISAAKEIDLFQSGSDGEYQTFEGGSIYWRRGSVKAFTIGKVIGEFYHRDKDFQSRLGFPIDYETETIISLQRTIGKFQRFEGGSHDASPTGDRSKGVSVYWTKKYGVHPVLGGLGICYEKLGGARSSLGFPIEDESHVDPDVWYQNFEGGAIYWREQPGAVPVIGAIFEVYRAHSGPGGKFGFPKAEQQQANGLDTQEFEGGVVSVHPGQKTQAHKWEMYSVPPLVDQIYRQVLGRRMDLGGLITYGAKLNRGEKSVRDVVREIGQSSEFKREILGIKPDDSPTETYYEKKVDLCVEHLLGRGADIATRLACVESVKELGFDEVINDLVDSEAYSLAFGDDCAPMTTSGLAVTVQVQAKSHCFYRGLNGHLYRRKGTLQIMGWDDDTVYPDAPTLPAGSSEGVLLNWENGTDDEQGFLSSAPAAVFWGSKHLECFYRGGDNRLWHRWWYDNEPSREGCLGDYLTSAPSVVSTGEDNIDCFYRGADNHLFYRHYEKGNWSQEVDLVGSFLTSAPAAVSWGARHLDCFYRGSNGGLCHRWNYGEGWSDEDNRGGYLTSAPTIISTGENFLHCFYRGLDFQLLYRYWDGKKKAWSEEKDLGGVLASAPTAVYLGEGNIDCYYRGQDNCLWHRRWDGKRWNPEENLGGILI